MNPDHSHKNSGFPAGADKQQDAFSQANISSPQAQRKFDEKLVLEITRLEESCDVIMQRHLRLKINAVIAQLKEIRINCLNDPGDIREEITLPIIAKQLADALQEYSLLTPHRIPAQYHQDQTIAINKIFSEASPWLKQLLTRMLSNDGEGLGVRAKVLSSIFEQGDRLHRVQQEVRQSLKPK